MSASSRIGGPAFPMPGADYTEDCGDFQRAAFHGPQQGMSLRDYFAAKAMPVVHEEYRALSGGPALIRADYAHIAADAYTMADAMLKARQS
jgi:hypothetical protein